MILRRDSLAWQLSRPFTRVDVLGQDSLGVSVACPRCPGAPQGRVGRADLVLDALPPDSAVRGSLADFALAVRQAAAARDLGTLRTLMAPDFTFSFVGPQHRDAALLAWRQEGFRSLDQVLPLLDQGLSPTEAAIWVAPQEYATRLDYRGLRLGFRRAASGRWEWVFLVRSEGGR